MTQLRLNKRCANSSNKRQISCVCGAFCFTLATSASHPTKERGFSMNRIETILTTTLLITLPVFCQAATSELKVKAVNTLGFAPAKPDN